MTESEFAKPWAAVPPLPRKSITEQSVNLQDGEPTTRVSTTGGPPLKMFVVEMSEDMITTRLRSLLTTQ